jgi:hypothetical protein
MLLTLLGWDLYFFRARTATVSDKQNMRTVKEESCIRRSSGLDVDWLHAFGVCGIRPSEVRIHDILLSATSQGRYVVSALGMAVLKLITEVRKRWMMKDIPQVGDKSIGDTSTGLTCIRQRDDKLNDFFHLPSAQLKPSRDEVFLVILQPSIQQNFHSIDNQVNVSRNTSCLTRQIGKNSSLDGLRRDITVIPPVSKARRKWTNRSFDKLSESIEFIQEGILVRRHDENGTQIWNGRKEAVTD